MKKVFSFLLVFLLLISLIPVTSASAATVTKKETKRAIAIVFDNSGSMYRANNGIDDARKAWCRATYAMEAFATMMNSGDVMDIYPMYPIEVNGKEYSRENPLRITQKTASTIREIYTPVPHNTHIEAISSARDGLQALKGFEEKWLIVLTDGDIFYRDDKPLHSATKTELEKELSESRKLFHTAYLGIGSQSAYPDKVDGRYKYLIKKTTSSTEVLSALNDMCNTIFGRKTLNVSTSKVTFDVSMSKLIVFAQGGGIQNVVLKNSSGQEWRPTAVDLKFSPKGGGIQSSNGGTNEYPWLTDETLQGTMATFEGLEEGSYELSYSGSASSISCYYEPDVDLSVQFLDENGNVVDPSAGVIAGKYYMKCGLVDKNGKPTDSALLRGPKFEVTYSIKKESSDEGTPITVSPNSEGLIELELRPGDTLDAHFKVTYLDDYTIERSGLDLGWPEFGLTFEAMPAGTLTAQINGLAPSYNLSKFTPGEKYRVSFTYEGEVLTGDQLGHLEQFQTALEGGNLVHKLEQDDEGYYFIVDFSGEPMDAICGDYTLKISAVYRNQDDQLSAPAVAATTFTLNDDSRMLEMSVNRKQDYYQLSKIADGEPILVRLTFGGQPLTEAELDAIEFNCHADGVKLLVEKDYSGSGFIIRIDPDAPPASGKYDVTINAVGTNEVGRTYRLEESTGVEFGVLPMWLRILIPIVIILVILLIIWIIMNQKVLPKGVSVVSMEFSVDGEMISVTKTPTFSGAGKNKGSMVIASPLAGSDPMAAQAMTLTLVAISPRRTPSKQRRAQVTNVSLRAPNNINYWKVRTQAYQQDPLNPGKFVNTVNGKPPFKPIDIGGTTEVQIQAETPNSSVSFSCRFKFK